MIQRKEQCGAVEACWAHNPEINESRPFPSIFRLSSTNLPKEQVSKIIGALSGPALVAQLVSASYL